MRDNTRVELGLRVRDNTRALYRAGPFRERCVGYTHSGGWGPRVPRGGGGGDLGLRVGMLGGNPRMARGIGAPRGRRVGSGPKCPSRTTNNPSFLARS